MLVSQNAQLFSPFQELVDHLGAAVFGENVLAFDLAKSIDVVVQEPIVQRAGDGIGRKAE